MIAVQGGKEAVVGLLNVAQIKLGEIGLDVIGQFAVVKESVTAWDLNGHLFQDIIQGLKGGGQFGHGLMQGQESVVIGNGEFMGIASGGVFQGADGGHLD